MSFSWLRTPPAVGGCLLLAFFPICLTAESVLALMAGSDNPSDPHGVLQYVSLICCILSVVAFSLGETPIYRTRVNGRSFSLINSFMSRILLPITAAVDNPSSSESYCGRRYFKEAFFSFLKSHPVFNRFHAGRLERY